jgi:hypothetical protein
MTDYMGLRERQPRALPMIQLFLNWTVTSTVRLINAVRLARGTPQILREQAWLLIKCGVIGGGK